MLWIEKYRPSSLENLVGQEQVVLHLKACAATGSVPHLIFAGPHGTGKSLAVEGLARALFGESWAENTTVIGTSDVLQRGRSGLEQDIRFQHLYRKDESLLTNFKYIIRWYASLQPINAPFKLFIFEDAHELTHDAQASLRRTMERYSPTCRFIFETTRPSGIIPAIGSRCLPLYFTPVPPDLVTDRLKTILLEEAVNRERVTDDLLDLIVIHAKGDIRQAVMLLELAVRSGKPFDQIGSTLSEAATVAASAFRAMQDRDIPASQRRLESLMLDYGLSGSEVLVELLGATRRSYNDPRIVSLIADADRGLVNGNNEFIQMNALAAKIVSEVFL
jgi:replication factor C small subunit